MLGTPNIVIGTFTFRPTKVDGEYTWDGATTALPNRIIVQSSRIKNGVLRIKFERQSTLAATATEPKALLRAYMVLEVPPVSGATTAVIQTLTGQIATFLGVSANVDALQRDEV